MQKSVVQQQKTAFKFVDMSSEGQSSEEEEKQNYQSSYGGSRVGPNHLRNQCKPCTNEDNSKLRSVYTNNKTTPLKDLQFSTLSLEDPSVDYDQLKSLSFQKSQLQRENQELKGINRELKRQVDTLLNKNGEQQNKLRDYQQRCEQFEAQVAQLRKNSKRMHSQFAKMQKEYENKLLNSQLPGSRTWIEQTQKIYNQIKDKVKGIADKHIKELSKQKMNAIVEEQITNMINELLEMSHNPKSHIENATTSTANRFRSKNDSQPAYRSQRMGEVYRADKSVEAPIGEDYKMLSKSIEKLKNMEKDIDKSQGSYLKKKVEQQVSMVSNGQHSRSRRKRIFQ